MKSFFMKKAIAFFMFAFAALSVSAQFTETFETQTPNAITFTSNGQSFSLTNAFQIYSSRPGIGYQGSNRLVDNVKRPGLNQVNSIKSSAPFSVKDLWFFASTDGGNNPSANGSIIITGRLSGAAIFTITKTTGFNDSYGADGGFTYLNFSTEGGVDNSNMVIDEIEFQIQGSFNYLGIDNFAWTPQLILPVTLLSYTATLQSSGIVSLKWQTSAESNTSRFIVERSADAVNYKTIATVNAAGNSHSNVSYEAIDAEPIEGINYYRLSGFDIDGKVKQLGIKAVKNSSGSYKANVYPNPATGSTVTIKSALANGTHLYIIADMSGKIIKTGIINSNRQPVNISQLAAGSYILKLSDGQVIRWVKN